MADEKANVCTFIFKKRIGGGTAMRRKADDDKKSSSEDETVVVALVGKKESAGLLSAKTVPSYFKVEKLWASFYFLLLTVQIHQKVPSRNSRYL